MSCCDRFVDDEGAQAPDLSMFDRYVMVDWSASSSPRHGRDSIWSCALDAVTGPYELANHQTRGAARSGLRELLVGSAGRRVLVGFDFSMGYPVGTAASARLDGGTPWQAMWSFLVDSVVDDRTNTNNRFQVAAAFNARVGPGRGPFWGCPARARGPSLHSTKAPGFPHHGSTISLAEFRRCEQRLRASGRYASSSWQLLGAGSVGSQSLVGIPVLAALMADPSLRHRVRLWPFTTGLTPDPTDGRADAVVFAEVWPGSIDVELGHHVVRDASQVISLSRHFASLDASSELVVLFAPAMDSSDQRNALDEEGWILGVA